MFKIFKKSDTFSNENHFWTFAKSELAQEILKAAGDYASDYCRQIVNENEALTIANLKAEGEKISEVHDITEWQQACSPVINELSAGHEDLYKKILLLAK